MEMNNGSIATRIGGQMASRPRGTSGLVPLSTERLFQAKGACLTPKHSSSLVGDGRSEALTGVGVGALRHTVP